MTEIKKPDTMIDPDKLIFGIGQVGEITGVSARQLRYWEQQKFISSVDTKKGQSRKYDAFNLIRIFHIKKFQEQGFTLQSAAQKADDFEKRLPIIKHFLKDKIKDIQPFENGGGQIDFGEFDDNKHLYGITDADGSRFEIKPK